LLLRQHGCAIVTVLPDIDATGQRGSVQTPSPPGYTNSTSGGACPLGSRHPAIVVADAVYPVDVFVRLTGTFPVARCARTPAT
jgi:hypothetical protein